MDGGMNEQVATNWLRLRSITTQILEEPERFKYLLLLQKLKEDSLSRDAPDQDLKNYLGFERAPAAKGNHHAYEGGLVAHLLEMWELWWDLREKFTCEPHINDQRVLKAIILHDLHKAYRTYELVREDPWETKYGDDDTNQLLTNDTKSLWLATRAGIALDPEQINALLWAEGGFSKTKPKWCSVLAKVCYTLDELSGNGLARISTRTLLDLKRTEPCVSG